MVMMAGMASGQAAGSLLELGDMAEGSWVARTEREGLVLGWDAYLGFLLPVWPLVEQRVSHQSCRLRYGESLSGDRWTLRECWWSTGGTLTWGSSCQHGLW